MRLRQLLRDEGQTVPSIAHDRIVAEAVARMAEQRTTALIVMQADQPVGIFTERDVVRCHAQNRHGGWAEIKMADGMTNQLIVAQHDDDLDSSLRMMLRTGIKHLPVASDGVIIALLPLRVMVQQHIEALTEELSYLQEYISDLRHAGQD